MYKFSKNSKTKLQTVNKKLQDIFDEVIKYHDCSIICGIRTLEEQQKAFASNCSKCDGIQKRSKHQDGLAVDVIPYPINWNDINAFYELAGCVKTIAKQKGINIRWGGDWKSFKDYPHWELV